MKLGGVSTPPAPAQNPIAPPESASPAGPDLNTNDNQNTGSSEKPFDEEPFDAGVEANEETDPKKFIEQLTGKLGQSLRKYNQDQGQPDFALEKFAINSLLAAAHTGEMNPDDQNDIIKKVKSSGENDTNNDNKNQEDAVEEPSGNPTPETDELDFDSDVENMNEASIFLKNPKKNNMFQEGSNDILDELKPCQKGFKQIGTKEVSNCVPIKEDLEESKKNSIFVNSKVIKKKLKETFNQDDMEPITKPAEPKIKPKKEEPIQPKRRDKPFLPNVTPNVKPAPKAIKEGIKGGYDIYHKSFTSAINSAIEYAKGRGYTIPDNEFMKIATGPRKPDAGNYNRYSLDLEKDGIPQKKQLHIQVYGMDNSYELNCYIF